MPKTTKKPEISIIMATWNRADLLHIPIESCINQTYDNWELLVMDDDSSDNTEEVVKSYKDSRIKYFKLPKQEYYTHVRNEGIKRSSGNLFAFRDSDGGWNEKFLEELSKPHRNEDVTLTYCGRNVYQDIILSKLKYENIKDLKPTRIVRPHKYTGLESVSNFIDVGDMMIKKSVFEGDFTGFSEKKDRVGYCSDAKLVDEIEINNPHGRFVMIDKPLHYYFYKHDGKVENMTDTKLKYRKEGNNDNELESLWEF